MAVEAEVLLYTCAGRHLCEEAKRQLRELQKKIRFEFRKVDAVSATPYPITPSRSRL